MMDLGTIRKNSREEIRFTVETYKGVEIVNARVWYLDTDGEYRPGKQGLAFRLDLLGEVLAALGKARKAVLQ
ncbi:transcriptional coactivator p15/PC4 family protein [Gemmobacter nectariphilus]|uniref:transcriptional coactivator p15/PC4 family protein n=1 Tax=Gemmobacter nectariphilus TaxID=220343 RepID=UPI00041CA509|nr:transcriptional coactivator p15/PC4 family protein [Gemmobacter nectariphilus]